MQAASNETAAGIARLEAERQSRLAAAAAKPINDLANELGESVVIARGPAAQREAYQRFIDANPNSRTQNLLLEWMLVAIGFLPLIMSLFAPRSRNVYYSLKAHAIAHDSTPECHRAQEVYRAHLVTDPSTEAFNAAYLRQCLALAAQWDATYFTMCDLANRGAEGRYRTYHDCVRHALEAWKPFAILQAEIIDLDRQAAHACMGRPSWPFSGIREDHRLQRFEDVFNGQFLRYFGWQNPAELARFETNLNEQAADLNQVVDQLEEEHRDFIAGRSVPTDTTQRVWHTQLRDRVTRIKELLRHYEQLNGSPFAWPTSENPLFRAQRFAMPPARVHPSATVSRSPASDPTSAPSTDQSGVHSLFALADTKN